VRAARARILLAETGGTSAHEEFYKDPKHWTPARPNSTITAEIDMGDSKDVTAWGILDTEENVWIGNADDPCPLVYRETDPQETMLPAYVRAQIAANITAVRLGTQLGRHRATRYPDTPVCARDTVAAKRTPGEAIARIEKGGF